MATNKKNVKKDTKKNTKAKKPAARKTPAAASMRSVTPTPVAKRDKPGAMPATAQPAATTPGSVSVVVSPPTPDQIALRAYEIWVASGRIPGRDEANWKQAERELTMPSVPMS